MVCGCRKGKLTKPKSKKPVSKTQKRHVYIHIYKDEHKDMCSFIEKPLKESGIVYEFKLDKKVQNRPYPYITVDDTLLCVKKIVTAMKKGEL